MADEQFERLMGKLEDIRCCIIDIEIVIEKQQEKINNGEST